jgi:hypothetical protein
LKAGTTQQAGAGSPLAESVKNHVNELARGSDQKITLKDIDEMLEEIHRGEELLGKRQS